MPSETVKPNALLSNLKLIESGQDVLIQSIELLQLTYFAATRNIIQCIIYNFCSCDALLSKKAGLGC